MGVWIIIAVLCIPLGVIVAGKDKGVIGGVLGAVLGPLGVLIAAVM